MKYLIPLGIVGILVIVGLFSKTETISIENTKPEVIEKEVTPDWAEDADAVQAAKDVIRRKELEAELTQLEQAQAETQGRIEEVKEELAQY